LYTIRKKFRFEASHILESSYSEDCQRFHGHSYIVEVFCASRTLNEDGMVIDFGRLKDIINPLIAEWDHYLIIPESMRNGIFLHDMVIFPGNPTAENMASYLYWKIKIDIHELLKVRIHETETGYAEYEGEQV
jgi:6-pyruvoyltetrahydropterin/6-carboxytetrahydropterin synthase